MNNAQILTHPAFDRPPVLNARRHGPTPRGVPMLCRERFDRRTERGLLRKWAKEHGIEPRNGRAFSFADDDKIRALKAQHEKRDLTCADYDRMMDELARAAESLLAVSNILASIDSPTT